MTFASPWFLLLILLVPLVLFPNRRQQRPALGFSDLTLIRAAGTSARQRLAWLPMALRAVACVLVILALARPQEGMEKIVDINQGIAIEMVLDRSGSMAAPFAYQGEEMTRLEAAKKVFLSFVNGDTKNLPGRPNDLIGMVAFARYADTICPLTLAHDALAGFLPGITLVDRRDEDGTAIGDALALAAARLKTAEETLASANNRSKNDYTITSKIIILLTDGENNMGEMSPEKAAELARDWGIKMYIIGIGGDEVMTVQTLFGARKIRTGRGVDQKTLASIAQATGGKFWLAEDGQALDTVYREIDTMEKSEVESIRYIDYKERFHGFALAGLVLLCIEFLLAATVFRRVP